MLAAEPPNALHPTRTPTPATAKIIFGAALGLPAVTPNGLTNTWRIPSIDVKAARMVIPNTMPTSGSAPTQSSLHSNARP